MTNNFTMRAAVCPSGGLALGLRLALVALLAMLNLTLLALAFRRRCCLRRRTVLQSTLDVQLAGVQVDRWVATAHVVRDDDDLSWCQRGDDYLCRRPSTAGARPRCRNSLPPSLSLWAAQGTPCRVTFRDANKHHPSRGRYNCNLKSRECNPKTITSEMV